MLKTALGTVDRMIVFNDLQIDHLSKEQEVGPAERAWPCFRRSGLLNLEAVTNYIIDSSPVEPVLWDRCNQQILWGRLISVRGKATTCKQGRGSPREQTIWDFGTCRTLVLPWHSFYS